MLHPPVRAVFPEVRLDAAINNAANLEIDIIRVAYGIPEPAPVWELRRLGSMMRTTYT